MIYFIGEEPNCDRIKIGYSKDFKGVLRRMRHLQTGNPRELFLLGVLKQGTLKMEKFFQNHYRAHHLLGEWYKSNKSLWGLVQTASHGLIEFGDTTTSKGWEFVELSGKF